MIALGFAGVTHAATISGTVEVDITENASNDYISTESITLGYRRRLRSCFRFYQSGRQTASDRVCA
jgi:hypothetical protein